MPGHSRQINWLRQLCDCGKKFALHVDGKYKLHYGRWVLITIGTHTLHYDVREGEHTHSFRPLVCALCREE
jgi:hypothetical protein